MENQENHSHNQRTKIRIKVTTDTDLKFVISACKSEKVKDLFKIIKDVYQEVVNGYGHKNDTKSNERREVEITSIRLGDYAVSLHQTIGDIIFDQEEIFCQAVQRKVAKNKSNHSKKEKKELKTMHKEAQKNIPEPIPQNKQKGEAQQVRKNLVNHPHLKQSEHKKFKNHGNKGHTQPFFERKQKSIQKQKPQQIKSEKKQPRVFDAQLIKSIKNRIIGSQ